MRVEKWAQKVGSRRAWAAKVAKQRENQNWRAKLALNAIECEQPFLYKPKIPPFPYRHTKAQVLSKSDCPLVDIHNTVHKKVSIDMVKKGDVVELNNVYALVRENTAGLIQIQLACSFIEETGKPDYGLRSLAHKDVTELHLLKRGHEILQLTHFDVQT